MSSFSTDTRSKSSSPLVKLAPRQKSTVQDRTTDIEESPFQFILTMDLSLVDTTLHDSPDLVIVKD